MSDRKVILVTGASRGIGRALAVAAGSSGYDIVINYRSSETEATKTVRSSRPPADAPCRLEVTLASEEMLHGSSMAWSGPLAAWMQSSTMPASAK